MDSRTQQWEFYALLFLALWIMISITWYIWIYFTTKLRKDGQLARAKFNLPPGPPGLPLLGNLLSLDSELHKHFASLSKNYGPIFSLRLGSKYGIVVSSPSVARQVLKDHDIIFANHDVTIAGKVLTYGGCDILLTPHGSKWQMMRKAIVQWLIKSTDLGSVHSFRRNQEVQKAIRFLYSRIGSPVDIGKLMFVTVLNTNTNSILGGTREGEERNIMEVEFREVMNNASVLVGRPNISDFFPLLAWFDLQGVEKQMRLVVGKFDQIFERLIKERFKKEERSGLNAEESKDFLEFLFKLKDEHKDSKTSLSMANIKALLMNMMIGGTETSSNTIEFAMAHIINEPEVMRRVQEELDCVVGKNSTVEDSHIEKLPYLLAVMKETLRLHPILPLLFPHCPSEATIVEHYTIPKGSRMFVNVWAIQRDPSVWDNPLQFDPTRFLDAQNYKGNDFKYLPFGSGRRICAGMDMAEKTFLYCIATLMHLYEWKLPHGQKLDMSEKFGLILRKKLPLVAIPTPRLPDISLYE